jgi:hypothetical protein
MANSIDLGLPPFGVGKDGDYWELHINEHGYSTDPLVLEALARIEAMLKQLIPEEPADG